MATSITLRGTKGAPLTHDEVDQNFSNLKDTADSAAAAVASVGGKANASAIGTDASATDMGTTPGSILSDNGTAKDWFQELETAVQEFPNQDGVRYSLTATEGQTAFDFSLILPAEVRATMTAAPIFYAQGVILEEGEDYTWSQPSWVLTLIEGASSGDIISIQNRVAFDQGVVGVANVIGLPAYIKGVLGDREANVLDIADWDNGGANDMAAGYQTLIDQAAAAGVPVVMQSGIALLGSTIKLPDGHVFEGYSHGAEGGNSAYSSTFLLAHSGKGFTCSGSGAPISIANQTTKRNQPAVAPGWAPTDHDFDYYFSYINDLKMTRITQLNATRGIFFNGGRNNIKEWFAQCFKTGLQSDYSYDTCNIVDAHMWPALLQVPDVRTYVQDNLRSFHLKRCDNWFMSQIFSIWHRYGFFIDYFPGDGNPNHPAGTASKLKISQADIDIGKTAYFVAPTADGHTAKFSQFSSQGLDTPDGSPLMLIQGPNTKIVGDFSGSRCGNVVRQEATATGSRVSLVVATDNYDITAEGFPAVEVVTGGGAADILPGSSITGGGVSPASSGSVTTWAP